MNFESFVKTHYADFYTKVQAEYTAALNEENRKKHEKEEQEKAQIRAMHKFYEYDFEYEVEFSYKGFTDSTQTEEVEFQEAFAEFSSDEFGTAYEIVDADNADFEKCKTFDEILKASGNTEDYMKKEFEKLLFTSDHRITSRLAENRWDYDARVVSEVEWSAVYYWKGHFDELWEQFKQLRFKEED